MSTRYRTGQQSLTSRARLAASATLRARRHPCWLCGHPIDYRARPLSRWSFSVDEIIPRSKGGSSIDPRNLRAAHYGCNSARGNRPPRRTQVVPSLPRSTDW